MDKKDKNKDEDYIEGAIQPPALVPPNEEDKDQAISNRDLGDWVKKGYKDTTFCENFNVAQRIKVFK